MYNEKTFHHKYWPSIEANAVVGQWALLSVRLTAPPAKTKANCCTAKNQILNEAALELRRLETKARPSKGSCQLLSDSAVGN